MSCTVPIDSSRASMTHDKIGESLDDVFRLSVDKGERTAAYTGRCRELFEKAAREGIELPDVARGYLMLRGARLGPERKAIVLAAAGQSYTERNVAQALRSTFLIKLGVTKSLFTSWTIVMSLCCLLKNSRHLKWTLER